MINTLESKAQNNIILAEIIEKAKNEYLRQILIMNEPDSNIACSYMISNKTTVAQ